MKIIFYDQLTGPEFAARIKPEDLILIPVSAPENHGEHLPLGTDIYISEAIAKGAGEMYGEKYPGSSVYLYPTITVGGATIRGRGSVKIKSTDLRKCLIFLGRRLIKQGFRRIAVISGHGGVPHVNAMDAACAKLTRLIRKKGPGAAMAPAARVAGELFAGKHIRRLAELGVAMPENPETMFLKDLHGGFMETSIMLAICPALVRDLYKTLPKIVPPERKWLQALGWFLKRMVGLFPFSDQKREEIGFGLEIGMLDLSWIIKGRTEGYCGDPAISTKELGAALMTVISERLFNGFENVYEKGEDPFAYRGAGYLFFGLIKIVSAIILVAGLSILLLSW